ncbi:MAG: hypothetical protein KBT29_02790 [Prevotellaceae bacterium]|nr:hypothetical protein [Candidatus Minthosoma caballi]
MEHNDYKYDMNNAESMMANEPTINMELYRTASFFEKHSQHPEIEDAVPLHEGFEALRRKLIQKHSEKKNSLIS